MVYSTGIIFSEFSNGVQKYCEHAKYCVMSGKNHSIFFVFSPFVTGTSFHEGFYSESKHLFLFQGVCMYNCSTACIWNVIFPTKTELWPPCSYSYGPGIQHWLCLPTVFILLPVYSMFLLNPFFNGLLFLLFDSVLFCIPKPGWM